MLPIGGRPLLEHILINLQRHGFDDIAINLHFMPEQICGYFGDGSRWGIRLHYVHEITLLGTAGAVRNMSSFIAGEKEFLVHYGDILTDQDLSAMLHWHHNHNALATLLIHQRVNSNSIITLNGEMRITGFLERPDEEQRRTAQSSWVNSGIAVMSSDILQHIPETVPADIPRDVYIPLLRTESLFGFPLTGYRCAIDSPQRYTEALRHFANQ